MYVEHIRPVMHAARSVDNGTVRVDLLCHLIIYFLANRRDAAPPVRFVFGAPADYRGMRIVAFQHLKPFRKKIPHTACILKPVGARIFSPYDVSEPVSPIK